MRLKTLTNDASHFLSFPSFTALRISLSNSWKFPQKFAVSQRFELIFSVKLLMTPWFITYRKKLDIESTLKMLSFRGNFHAPHNTCTCLARIKYRQRTDTHLFRLFLELSGFWPAYPLPCERFPRELWFRVLRLHRPFQTRAYTYVYARQVHV